jgi:hypothetical protein
VAITPWVNCHEETEKSARRLQAGSKRKNNLQENWQNRDYDGNHGRTKSDSPQSWKSLKKKIRIIIEQDVSSVEYTGGGILGPMMIIKREKIKTWNRENNEDTRLRNHSKRRFEVR